MKFTINADSYLAQLLRARQDMDITLIIVAHDPTFTETEKLVEGRLAKWTVREMVNRPDVMEVEWIDHTKFLEMCTLSASPHVTWKREGNV